MREVRADLPSISLVISLSPSLLTGVSLSVSLSRHKHRAVDTRHHLLPPLHAGRVRGSPPTLVFGVVSSSSYILLLLLRRKWQCRCPPTFVCVASADQGPEQAPVLYRSRSRTSALSPRQASLCAVLP